MDCPHTGLDVHDLSDNNLTTPLPSRRNGDLPIEPGVFYIPEENIGVRIEDTVLVTEGRIRMCVAALAHRSDSHRACHGPALAVTKATLPSV